MRLNAFVKNALFIMFLAGLCSIAVQAGSIPRVIRKTIRETNRAQKLSIKAQYPVMTGSAAAADFNRRALEMIRKEIADFKKDLGPPEAQDQTRTLEISCIPSLVDSRLASIGFSAYTFTNGAHPNTNSFVFNYDLKKKHEVMLGDLFKSGSNYLKTISDYCIRHLKNKDSDMEWLNNGAGPKDENYRSWVITRTGISVMFDAYQVASYAEGPKAVVVPWRTVRAHIDKNGVAGHLVR